MASDESSISSGSRIRQFGLYRSIDARTEEFLRLSRKRQMRQGCACAAASTAITVTVVIVIFFVYEFTLNSGTTLENSLKSGWLSLMNDTSEDSSFDPKLTKVNIDRTTLKLLPLLIKAIKKNAVLEKLLDDHSNSNPFNDKKDDKETIGEIYERNTFTRNWLKIPSTKMYAIEYKTSPVVYYRDPTKNIEYYTKIRKIRDYQRVFNYVDKMISEKVYIRSSRPMPKEESQTESAFHFKLNKITRPPKFPIALTDEPKNNVHKKTKLQCKCPHNLGKLLQKLLTSMQNLVPEGQKEIKLLDCEKNYTVANKKKDAINNLLHLFSQMPVTLLMTTPRKEVTSIYTTVPPKFKNTSFSEYDSVAKTYNFSLSNNFHSFEPLAHEQFSLLKDGPEETIKTKNSSKPIKAHMTLFNKYKNIINDNQILRRPELKSKKNNEIEPIFDGIEYDDDSHYTSTIKSEPVDDNKIRYMATKVNYLNDIILKNYKKKTKTPMKYFKRNKSDITPKKSTILDLQVVDNKIALVKTKSMHTNKMNLNTKPDQIPSRTTPLTMFDNINNTPTSSIKYQITTESKLNNSNEIRTKNLTKSDNIDLPFILNDKSHMNTLKPTYFNYSTNSQDNKTIYHIVKNSIQTFLNKTLRMTPNFNKTNHSTILKKPNQLDKSKNGNKTNIFMLIENHVNSLMRKNLSALKAKLQKTKEILQKIHKDKINTNISQKSNVTTVPNSFGEKYSFAFKNYNKTWFRKITTSKPYSNVITLRNYKEKYLEINNNVTTTLKQHHKELSSLSDPDGNIELFITGITKPPESTIYRNDNDTLLEKKSTDLTWEDLNNEFMPALKSMIPDPTVFRSNKPVYLEYHKTEDRPEDRQEEDFSINSNFYDINL